MLDLIRNLFKKEFQLSNSANIAGYLHHIVALLHEQYAVDKNSKNAGIDAVCKLLQEYKDPQP